MSLAGHLLLALGALVLLLASVGLFALHDALSRQHAATKAGSLGVVSIVAGAALIGGDMDWIGRAIGIIAIVWLTMPVASHVLARAALFDHYKAKEADRTPPLNTANGEYGNCSGGKREDLLAPPLSAGLASKHYPDGGRAPIDAA